MRKLLHSILGLVLLGSPSAFAQDNTLFFENFQNGLPATWTSSAFLGQSLWHLAENGECGALTRMVAFNHGPAVCNYTGFAVDAQLEMPPITLTSAVPIPMLTFDYMLDVDAQDLIDVSHLDGNGASQLLADAGNLVHDGALHSIALDVPYLLTLPSSNVFDFLVSVDGDGDHGRGFFIDNVRLTAVAPSSLFCDGAVNASCPCGNGGGQHRGCANSTGEGALLRGAGAPSIGAESLRLYAIDVPSASPTLFFEGSAQASAAFGDGRLCVGGAVIRLGTKTSVQGLAVYPEHGDARIAGPSGVSAGSTRYYQALYRDAAGPCHSGLNLSNGWSATWIP
jgi:hypothetical protein